MPGAKGDFDIWDTLLREFITNNHLDLRNKGLVEISPKLLKYENLVAIDLS